MIGTPKYKLAKILDSVIKPSIPDKYMLSSTNHFIEKLKQVEVQSHQILVSFDVVSLFTNVPLEETTQIIANYLFDKDNPNTPSMEKHAFIKLMKLATQGMFLYNGELFKQIDGVAMRLPGFPWEWDSHGNPTGNVPWDGMGLHALHFPWDLWDNSHVIAF